MCFLPAWRARWPPTNPACKWQTLRNLLLAWVLTLPVCIFLGAMFFAGGLLLMARVFGAH